MLTFLLAGGLPSMVILVLAVWLLIVAGRFAASATAGRLATVRALARATTCAVVTGVAGNLIAVAWTVSGDDELMRAPLQPLLRGVGEALTPAVLGGTALAITWMLIAYGLRRLPASELDA